MRTEGFHKIIQLDDDIKKLEARVKDLKAKRTDLKDELITELAESQLMGLVIGTKQLAITQKYTMNIHNKEALKDFLRESHPEFLTVDVDSKGLESYLKDLSAQTKSETEEETEEYTIPESFGNLVSFFKINDLKITKAKAQ